MTKTGNLELICEYQQQRIETLHTALRAALTVLREWINRAERNGGVVDIEDIEGAKRLYATMLRAYREEG